MSSDLSERQIRSLAALFRAISRSSISEAVAKARTPKLLAGTVEDLSDELDVVFARIDQEALGGDPAQSDNYENPGIIPVHRLGETFTDEQVRITFDGSAGGSAMRTGIENRIVLPFGEESGQRIILDGNTGTIEFYDVAGNLVGFLDATQWFVGTPGSALARLDPLSGLRLRDSNDRLRAQLSPFEGLTLRDPVSGISGVIARHDGIVVLDPTTGEEVTISSGQTSSTPTPRWKSSTSTSPGSSHSSPAVDSFGTNDDIDLRFVCASVASDLGTQSYTPPTNYTEQSDVNSSGSGITLAMSSATRDPAISAPGAASFTNTSAGWTRENGHSVVVRGGGATSPSFRSVNTESILSSASKIGLDIDLPASVAQGDMLVAFVAIAGPNIPVGWTVPDGWVQLGVSVAGAGTSHILASGVWMKLAGASEPASSHVDINMSESAATKVQATVLAIQNPFKFTAGLDVRVGGISLAKRPAVIPTQAGQLGGGFVLSTNNSASHLTIYRGNVFGAPLGPVVRVKFKTNNTNADTGSVFRLSEAISGLTTAEVTNPQGNTTANREVAFEWLHGLNLDTSTAAQFQIEIQSRRQGGGGTSNHNLFNPHVCEFVPLLLAPNANSTGNGSIV